MITLLQRVCCTVAVAQAVRKKLSDSLKIRSVFEKSSTLFGKVVAPCILTRPQAVRLKHKLGRYIGDAINHVSGYLTRHAST